MEIPQKHGLCHGKSQSKMDDDWKIPPNSGNDQIYRVNHEISRDSPKVLIDTCWVVGQGQPSEKYESIGMIIETQYFWENAKLMATSHHQPVTSK